MPKEGIYLHYVFLIQQEPKFKAAPSLDPKSEMGREDSEQKLQKEDKSEKQQWGNGKAAMGSPVPKPPLVVRAAGQVLSTVVTLRTAVNVHEAAL